MKPQIFANNIYTYFFYKQLRSGPSTFFSLSILLSTINYKAVACHGNLPNATCLALFGQINRPKTKICITEDIFLVLVAYIPIFAYKKISVLPFG